MGFERRALASPSAIGELRRALVSYAESMGADRETCDAVALAASEALTNVVRHAYAGRAPGPVTVEARPQDDGRLLITVCDEGPGLVARASSPGLGLGLGLMAQVADDFRVANRHDARGTIVSLGFALTRPSASNAPANPTATSTG